MQRSMHESVVGALRQELVECLEQIHSCQLVLSWIHDHVSLHSSMAHGFLSLDHWMTSFVVSFASAGISKRWTFLERAAKCDLPVLVAEMLELKADPNAADIV